MKREEMILACCSDLAGKVRGKAFPAAQFEKRLRRGIGWTPTNVQITCFDVIAESPFGSFGDVVLIPDAKTSVAIDIEDGMPPERFVLGNIHYTDGRPWEFCTRSILQDALAKFKEISGLTLFGAFEHEFQFRNMPDDGHGAFTLAGLRAMREFCESVIAAMRQAGVSPDTILREFGAAQYEVTMNPQEGVAIADHSVITREVVGAVSNALGRQPTFTPIRDPAGVGNGVHIHMSFLDPDGKPATWDAGSKHELSPMAAKFVAGILKYLDSIIAITAPSVISYLRLTPHRWSAAFNNLGFRDREASVRICPGSDISDVSKASQFNFEFRAADATASPYLQLAALVYAGIQGIKEDLPVPDATAEDLAALSAEALASRGLVRLPQSLQKALDCFSANDTVKGWFPKGFADVYVKHKQREIKHVADLSEQDTFGAYERVY